VLGLFAGWLGVGRESLVAGIRKRLGKKGAEVLQGNEDAFAAGVRYAEEHPLSEPRTLVASAKGGTRKLVVDGNEICAAAAIFAGCEFFGGYPITPSSEVMHFLGREIWKYGGTMIQAEDEIAGIGACVGASFAGKKVLTATSGPGMSLKTEMLGLASIAELPLVCLNVQRGGPSTGIPTKSEQSDLFQACFSAHGDVVRPVLAPTSVADTFAITVEAFNAAEEFQTPVILLSDQEIAQRKETVDPIDSNAFRIVERQRPSEAELGKYVRFKLTDSGISPISHPGMAGGNYLASGIEHNERGAPTASGEMHARMNEKRIRKLDPLKYRRDLFVREGDPHAPLALVAWGSLAGTAREGLEIARREGIQAKLLVPKLLFPVAEEVYAEFFRNVQAGLVVEQSHQGQLYRILRMYVDVPAGVRSLARSGSNPILPLTIVEQLKQLALALQRRRVADVEPAG
jgi:2-oxoglutarate ferredoxin oxidoreductase subunit alpha